MMIFCRRRATTIRFPIPIERHHLSIYVLFLLALCTKVYHQNQKILFFENTHRISSSSSSSSSSRSTHQTHNSNSSDALDKIRFEGLTDKSKLKSQVCCLGFYFLEIKFLSFSLSLSFDSFKTKRRLTNIYIIIIITTTTTTAGTVHPPDPR